MALSGRCTPELPGELSENTPVPAPPIGGDSAPWGVAQNDIPSGKPSKKGPGRQQLEEQVFKEPQGVFQMVGLRMQATLRIQGFCILNRPRIKNIQEKKKSRKLEKAKLEFATSLQLFT